MYAPEYANWLASYPKSGNTWVRLFLNAYTFGHLDINGTGVTRWDCDIYTYNAISPYPISDMRPETIIYLRHAALLHLMVGKNFSPIIFKTHTADINIGGVATVPRPLTRAAVYLVRDPRDVCVSFAKHLDLSIDETIGKMSNVHNVVKSPDSGIGTWLTTWSGHVTSWDKDFVTCIKYEDLKADPEIQFTRILKAFGIKLDKRRLKKAIRLCDIEQLKKQEAKQKFIEIGKQDKFFGQGKGWQNELSDDQARRIESDHREVMEKHGYLQSNVTDIKEVV